MIANAPMTLGRLSLTRCFARLGVLCLASACARPAWDGHTYASGAVQFQTGPIAHGWHRMEGEPALLAFRDPARDLVISVNGRCGKDSDDVPLSALTQHLFLYFTDRQPLAQTALSLDGREALRTELSAKLDGVQRRFVVYVMKKDGCVYDFILIAEPTVSPSSVSEFDRFVSGFSTNAAS